MPGNFVYTVNDLLQCEMYLVEALNCDLLVFHPYAYLDSLLVDAGMEHQKVRIKPEMDENWKIRTRKNLCRYSIL